MWIGNIENFRDCKCISRESIDLIVDFINKNDMLLLPDGRYELGNGNYVNVFKYDTRSSDGIFEMHKKYVDVHYPIVGEETVCFSETFARETKPYDEKDDYSLGRVETEKSIALKNKTLCVFSSEEVHKAGIVLKDSTHVKKAVFKIMVRPIEK